MKYLHRTIKLREVIDTWYHFCIRVEVREEELSKRQGKCWFTNVDGQIFKLAQIFVFCNKIRAGRENKRETYVVVLLAQQRMSPLLFLVLLWLYPQLRHPLLQNHSHKKAQSWYQCLLKQT